ncbi:F-box and WD repeat domain containing protein 10B [Leuresthes tenuis]|uniref:F-box and WD repeat domain containing protein 10B n=1 Tax=Leuresthes tenuis TaxID=355514 RepID=UPI003B513267
MKSVRENTPACEFNAQGCLKMCGMCPSCVFAPKPPGSTHRLWKASDEFKRKFTVALLLRCRDVQLLESIQRLLSVTSLTWCTYARSRSPASPRKYPSHSPYRELDGKPLGMDMDETWNWFNSSSVWKKSSYLCRIFSLCDMELLRMLSNLTSVLLVRQKRGFMQFGVNNHNPNQHDQDTEDPALMVVPGSSKSVSGVSQYRDFIGCLPVDLSKRILGLLETHSLRRCKRVCRSWKHLTDETMEEMKFRRIFQDQIKAIMEDCSSINKVNPTYVNIVEVTVPVRYDEEEDVHSAVQRVKPFEAAYAKTKTVQMEERNVYCGAYFTKMLQDKEDPHRVLDYKGGLLMATGSKDRLVHLLYVASETNTVAVMRGHVGSIRAVLLCEERNLLITAGCDASIRCWNLKTNECEMVLYGHTGTIRCLDVHADRLVSGAKDHTVKVWSLQTWMNFKDFHFKHHSSVQCVKIDKTTIYSSCRRGLVKIWSMETASLLRVIDAHKSSVKCLFFNEWYLLSGDCNGKVMAWSVSGDDKECLKTFTHPAEVKSLALIYLRVITGCVDGNIRIFNFLTGDCLRNIMTESESSCILSLHFNDHSILVNTTCSVKLYQFAKVFLDYADARHDNHIKVVAQDDLISERSTDMLKFSYTSTGRGDMTSNTQKNQKWNSMKSERMSTTTKSRTRESVRRDTANQSVMQSERATCERMKKRGPHHPLTRDSILLRVGAIQRLLCMDEVSVNMESNARLRDSWGARTPPDLLQSDTEKQNTQTQLCPLQPTHDGHHRRPKTCAPVLKKAVSQNMKNTPRTRDVFSAPRNEIKKAHSHSDNIHGPNKRMSGFSKNATVGLHLPNPECCIETRPSLPALLPFRGRGGFRPLPVTQLKDSVQANTELIQKS